MDDSEENELQKRIKLLEEEIKHANDALKEAEDKLTNLEQRSPLEMPDVPIEYEDVNQSHHALENKRLYGQTDGIVFVKPQELLPVPQECVDHVREKKGLYARVYRSALWFNIDDFASRPRLHQWIQNGKVFREAREHQASKFELFFDLLFVGIVHQIADAAAEQPTGSGLAQYILTFCPAYSIWSDVRDIINQFGTDDVTQRSYILWIMILLVGYSNNASVIEISEGGEVAEGVVEAVLTSSQEDAIQWALGFAAVAKLSRAILSLVYSYFLPLSREPIIIQALNPASSALLYLICIFLPLHGQISLVAISIVLEYAFKLLGVLTVKTIEAVGKHRQQSRSSSFALSRATSSSMGQIEKNSEEGVNQEIVKEETIGDPRQIGKSRKDIRIPAINIEHHVDRLGAFVTIVLGEMVMNVFISNNVAPRLSVAAGRSFLALMLAFNLNWLYFGSEACQNFIHALRRHWLTGAVFTYIHLPLIMSLLLASSATNRIVTNTNVASGLKFFFGTGVGVSIVCMSVIGALHKSLEESRSVLRVSRIHILVTRALAGCALSFIPFVHDKLDSIQLLATYVGVTGLIIALEIIARLERRMVLAGVE